MGSEARVREAVVNADSIRIPTDWNAALDVHFDGRRVFTIAPGRYRADRDGLRTIGWPERLQPYLKGTTEVVLREHSTGTTLLIQEVSFGESTERVAVADADGVALSLTKWGTLGRPFEALASTTTGQLLRDVEELLGLLNEIVGQRAFIAYGTLLGAVRGGTFIAHDTDMDVSYYSRHEHPADIARESFHVQRELRVRGWRAERNTGAFLQTWASDEAHDEGGGERKIDVFTSYHCGGIFAMDRWVRGPLLREAILPLSTVTLEGVELPAPANPEALLTLTYGDGWRTPDPSFRFRPTRDLWDRTNAWFGYLRYEQGRWAPFTETDRPTGEVARSSFAAWVDERCSGGSSLIDLGCGVGHDATWFAQRGRRVIGADYLPLALSRAEERARVTGSSVELACLNLYDLRAVLAWAGQLAAREHAPVLYARRLIDAVRPAAREHLWLLAKILLGGGGQLALEFATSTVGGKAQPPRPPFIETHDPDRVIADVSRHGGTVDVVELTADDGVGVCRLTASWKPGG